LHFLSTIRPPLPIGPQINFPIGVVDIPSVFNLNADYIATAKVEFHRRRSHAAKRASS
jgi:hypothetical protein